MSIFKVLDTHISSCVSSYPTILDNAANDSILRGTEFMLFSLLKIFDENDIDYIEEGIVDSGYRKENLDYGIDAIYITASNDIVNLPEELDDYNEDTKFNIHLLQFKRGTGVEQGELLKFQNGIKKILIDEKFNEPDNLYFFNRLNIFNEIKNKIYTNFPTDNIAVIPHIVFGGLKDNIIDNPLLSEVLDNIIKDLKNNGYNNVKTNVLGCEELINYSTQSRKIIDTIEYQKTLNYITDTDNKNKLNGYICIVKGMQIAELVRKHQTSLFEANIRDYYKRNDLNGSIIETSASDESKYFWSFNNGLTMTCSKVEELPNNKYRLHDLQIVNGCQTSNSIYHALKNKERVKELLDKKASSDKGLNQKEQEELDSKIKLQFNDDTSLLVKIIETNNDDLIFRITETTNSQTPIKAFSLKANDNIQKLIEQYLGSLDISYERRINELRNKGKKNIYNIQKLFQLFSSQILMMPSQVRTRPKRLFISNYDNVFPAPDVKQLNYSLYYIPLMIDIAVNKAVKKFMSDEKTDIYKKTLMTYGKFHLGCFILSSILKNEYSEKGIIKSENLILDELKTNLDFHFQDALENFEKVVKAGYGNRRESISSAVRKTELDTRIKKFVKNRK